MIPDCYTCVWYLRGREVGCLEYGKAGRHAEVQQIKKVLVGAKCKSHRKLDKIRSA